MILEASHSPASSIDLYAELHFRNTYHTGNNTATKGISRRLNTPWLQYRCVSTRAREKFGTHLSLTFSSGRKGDFLLVCARTESKITEEREETCVRHLYSAV